MNDPVLLIAELLTDAFPAAEVETDAIQSRALSSPFYIFIKELGGTTPRPGRLDEPTIEIIVYSSGRAETTALARDVQMAIREAWMSQTVTDHGHIAHFETEVRPHLQNIAGLPKGQYRTSQILSISTRPKLT